MLRIWPLFTAEVPNMFSEVDILNYPLTPLTFLVNKITTEMIGVGAFVA